MRPRPSPDRLAVGDRRVVRVLDPVEARLGTAGTVVHDLAGPPLVAGMDHVALADLPARDADLLGEPVEHAFHGELGLVGAEPAERAAHEVVGANGDRLDVERVPAVGTARVAGRPFEHLHPDARVRARVADAAHLERSEVSVRIASGPVLEPDRMALGVHPEALFARERALHRPVEQPCRERGVGLIAHVLLAPERTPVRHEFDGDPIRVDVEHSGDVVAVVPHALAARVHVERARVALPGRYGKRRLGFEERVLDALRLERARAR